MSFEDKSCVVCGRSIEWRKKWARSWDEVKYCSDRCRKRKLTDLDRKLESATLELLRSRGRGKTICPSEAARSVCSGDVWRDHMEDARMAARRLIDRGEIEMTQSGQVVDASTAKGAVRLRLVEKPGV